MRRADTGRPVPAITGETTGSIDFALMPGLTITGRVTDAASGLPLGGVEVQVMSSASTTATYTDGSGNYRVWGLAPGTYYLRTSNWIGYLDQLYDNLPCEPWCTPTSGTPVMGGAAQTLFVNFALVRGGTVTGHVTDAASRAPLANVGVDIYSADGTWWTSGWTDASGAYSAGGLPTGTYRARTYNSVGYLDELFDDVSCVRGMCSVMPGTPIPVVAGTTTGDIDFALVRGGEIRGRITNSSGSGIGWANVQARRVPDNLDVLHAG